MRTVYTIHNMEFRGTLVCGCNSRNVTGLDSSYSTIDKLESYGNASLLKGGIVYADHITTVSATYAKEIQSAGRWRRAGWSDACKIVCTVRKLSMVWIIMCLIRRERSGHCKKTDG